MAYHDSEKLAFAALAEIGERFPADVELSQKLFKHFTPLGKTDYPRLHAALILVLEKTPAKAVDRLTGERAPLHFEAALGLITGAIANGPESWKMDKDAIYGLGFIHIKNRFFTVREGFEKGSFFDRTCRMVRPAYQPILDEAIFWAFTSGPQKKGMALGPKILSYIPVQLLPPSAERDFKMNALSLRNPDVDDNARRYTVRAHAENIEKSARAVTAIAEQLNIMLPVGQLERANMELPRDKNKRIAASAAGRDFRHRPVAQIANSNAPLIDEAKELRRTLVKLVDREEISLDEAKIYLWLNTGKVVRRHKDAADHFKKPSDIISLISEKVGGILRRSDVNLHQPRSVRPE